jgi:1,2-diacylglycerol 3-beta-glucosyltransferase
MSVAFVTYTLVIVVHYFRYRPATPGDGSALAWHLFVPALNEEKVIGETVDYLRATFPTANVWVIDDDSDDRTGPIVSVRALADPLVHLVSRRAPEARTGKGDALNAAYRALNEWLPVTADRAHVIVGVIDADGRPAPNCFDVCAGGTLFGDPAVGSVQVMVRMMNRDSRTQFPHRGRFRGAGLPKSAPLLGSSVAAGVADEHLRPPGTCRGGRRAPCSTRRSPAARRDADPLGPPN